MADSSLLASTSPFLPLPHVGEHGSHCHPRNASPNRTDPVYPLVVAVIVKSVAKVYFDTSDKIALPPSPTPHSTLVNRAKEHRSENPQHTIEGRAMLVTRTTHRRLLSWQ